MRNPEGKPLVLVVDDDPATRLLMHETLRQAGFTVEEAEDGAAALAAVTHRQPDVLLLDVLMPKLDGFDVCLELRKKPETEHLPVIMVTGLDDEDSIRRAFDSGATDFITKPINWATLGYHVDYLMRAGRAFEELQESRAYYNAILEDIPLLICRWAPDGTIHFVNSAYSRYFGKPAEELIGQSFMPLIPDEDLESAQKHIASLSPDRPLASHEHRVIRADGEIRWQLWTDRAILDENGRITEFQSVGEDITEQKNAAEKLLLAREVFLHSDEMIAVTDAAATIIDVNPSFCRRTGYNREEIIGRNMRMLQLERQDRRLYENHDPALLTTGAWQGELNGRSKSGETFTCLMTVNAVRDGEGEPTHFVHLSTDISRLKKVEAELRQLALFDPLTGLANRDLLHDRLQQALYESEREHSHVALLLLDLDNFKDVNDTLGHPSGDRILAQVGKRLRERTRHSDTVARMGGDEFVIVLRNVAGAENVGKVAQEIIERLSKQYLLEDQRVYLTVSLGIALFPLDGRDTDELIRNADTAMYHAKGLGKNRYQFYTEELNRRAKERLTLQTDLRRALEWNEFVVYYQPKISLKTSELTGVEALVRWQKPDVGLVPPATFIPLAEETGLIVPIGEKVLQLVCAQLNSWQSQGISRFPVAVNLSTVQLREEGLATTIRKILMETALDPGALELEITESAIMQESEKAISTLHALRDMGIRITMDDFGTGYSSLSYLKRFPISSLKIDRSFIADVIGNPDDAEIIRAIIAMAHRLRLIVVAEGVETAEQLAFLRREGCNEAQGYFFARPMPAEEFSRWLQTRSSTGQI